MADLVAAMQAETTLLRVHTIVATPKNTTTSACEGWPSERWADAATTTGGMVHPLCGNTASSLQAIVDSL